MIPIYQCSRHCERSEAIQTQLAASGLPRRFAPRNDGFLEGGRPARDGSLQTKASRLLPWILLDTAKIPGGGELKLKRRGGEFSIMLGDNELMNSRLSGSEEALATLSAAKIGARPSLRMLIGGLGMGFTLRAALKTLDASAHIEVAELVPAVVAWARGPMEEVFAGSLADSRARIREGDVGEIIRSSAAAYDAILLDVDNGPDGLTRKANDSLYDGPGLTAARKALKPGGVLAVWSSGPDEDFTRRLRKAGFTVEENSVRAGRSKGKRHMIWIATRA
jgi:spermidine synthase